MVPAHIVQDKQDFGLWVSYVSTAPMDWRLRPTCKREVAVSVRTPPRAPRWAGRAVLAAKSEDAGRERREMERANTIMNYKTIVEIVPKRLGFTGVFEAENRQPGSCCSCVSGGKTASVRYVRNWTLLPCVTHLTYGN